MAEEKKVQKKLIAFGYYGGKYSHLGWLLPLLPKCRHFVDVFGGSAAVIINREPSPVETYNDLDGDVVNFFRVLREKPDELIRQIGLTPFSREELQKALITSDHDSISEVEKGRRFFIKARQTRTGLAQKSSNGRWAYCILTSRAGMAGSVSRWLGSVDGLSEIAQRLLRIQIENDTAIAVINRYDSPETLFYCDPPYPHESRGDSNAYGFEMSDAEHIELSKVLHNVEGMVALSGYHCDLLDGLYSDWSFVDGPTKLAPSIKKKRTEVLWINYPLDILNKEDEK